MLRSCVETRFLRGAGLHGPAVYSRNNEQGSQNRALDGEACAPPVKCGAPLKLELGAGDLYERTATGSYEKTGGIDLDLWILGAGGES